MDKPKGLIAWFVHNPVAANLLMWVLLIGGVFSALSIKKEMFPIEENNAVNVSVAYPGAAPQEIEEGIVIKIEEAVKNIRGVKKLTSNSGNGIGTVNIEIASGYKPQDVLDKVKLQVDAISTFPGNIEKPIITHPTVPNSVIWVAVSGEVSKFELKKIAKEVREDIANLSGITQVKLRDQPNNEIAIEVSENKLREYGLSFNDVVQAVQNSSFDLPGGAIRASDGDILLRTQSQAYSAEEYGNILVATTQDGSRIFLSQLADIKDGLQEGLFYTRFNAKPAAIIEVSSIDDEDAIRIGEQVRNYVAAKQPELPQSITVNYWGDLTHYLDGRLNMMLSNMWLGALLVFLLLAFFLDLKLAFWVMLGIPISFLGAIFIMPFEPFSLSINMITLFSFLLVLGIVVDDAIVIGESVYTEVEEKGSGLDNVIAGAKRVAMPATFGVLTTIVAFIPSLYAAQGFVGEIFKSIAWVVILCLAFSLIESKWILPAHLRHLKVKPKSKPKSGVLGLKAKFNQGMQNFVQNYYQPFIKACVSWRYTVVAVFVGLLILSKGMVDGGSVRQVFFPNVPSDFIQVHLEMNKGVSEQKTLETTLEIEQALYRVDAKMQQKLGYSILENSQLDVLNRTKGFIFAELTKGEDREVDGAAIARAWREENPTFTDVKKLTVDGSTQAGASSDVAFRLMATNLDELTAAAKELKQKLASFEGVYGISDNFSSGSKEVRLQIRPEAQALGLTLADLARQVRYGFYGYEAQRILRNREEVKVMVRYPAEQRRTLGHLEKMMIRTKDGSMVPFGSVAKIEFGESLASINRTDGHRAITVTANVDKTIAEPGKMVSEVNGQFIPTLTQKYRQLTTSLDGRSQEAADADAAFKKGLVFVALVIFGLMAIPLKSYTQPLLIMAVIPFSVIGAVFGHWLLGVPLSVLSQYGILALFGVVVNDALVMMDYINKSRQQGTSVIETAINAGCRRFRAIVLTSLTTVVGLIPIMFETSLQAKIVIPMAISLAFGIAFATVVTLVLMPALYVIHEDIRHYCQRIYQWWWQPKSLV
ncbi:efflux RND transporter permease subunit [Parashewanella curva]|uniref:Efflux RND transporter permease subunit n=1 Tax=Parashewanella curva TaxID=2338552 RepID=A0A3L8PWS4_9GAMM|nr:efflux RND transporter permease subunit [Parashewanella curva]RLV59751.1 efflux RND transporter permease subunit [Parashewanella curva]